MKKYIQPQTTTALLIEPIMNSAGTSVTQVQSASGPIQKISTLYLDIKDAL